MLKFDTKVDSIEDAYSTAIQLLSRREHSVSEMRQKLRRKFSESELDYSELDAVINRLLEASYISDRRYAESYIRARINKGFGAERIAMELHGKGVDGILVEETMAEFEHEWLPSIEKVWHKKFKNPPSSYTEKMKQLNFLRYRGFSNELISVLFENFGNCEKS